MDGSLILFAASYSYQVLEPDAYNEHLQGRKARELLAMHNFSGPDRRHCRPEVESAVLVSHVRRRWGVLAWMRFFSLIVSFVAG